MRYLFWTGLTVAGFSAGMGTFSLLIGKTSVVPWVVSAISAIATIFWRTSLTLACNFSRERRFFSLRQIMLISCLSPFIERESSALFDDPSWEGFFPCFIVGLPAAGLFFLITGR